MKLDKQTALIVGGARGIGEAIARKFAAEGARIVIVDLERMKSEADQIAREIEKAGGKALALAADCTDAAQVDRVVDATVRNFVTIDILVNSAGLRGPLVPVHEISEQEWDAVHAVNLKAAFLCCKAV